MFVQFDPAAFVADPELLNELEKRSSPVVCDADRILFEQGETAVGLYILHDGRATLSMTAEGHTVLSVETGPGALLGLPGIIGNQPYSMTGIAHAGADVRFVGREEFTSLMHSNPKLAIKILQVLAAEVRTARSALY
jgi:CRP-like cAMP-binding protein